jgi:hypothetical protein
MVAVSDPVINDSRRAPDSHLERTDGGVSVLWMVSCADRREHYVSEQHAAETMRAGIGRYLALCDIWFAPLAMSEAPGPRCRRCNFLVVRQHGRATQPERRKWNMGQNR